MLILRIQLILEVFYIGRLQETSLLLFGLNYTYLVLLNSKQQETLESDETSKPWNGLCP